MISDYGREQINYRYVLDMTPLQKTQTIPLMLLHAVITTPKLHLLEQNATIFTVTVARLIFRLFVGELDCITMQVLMLMPQEASGSNQCYIKSRREHGSSVKQKEDALRWQLEGNCIDFQLATSTPKLLYTEHCVLCIRDGNGSSKAHASPLTWKSAWGVCGNYLCNIFLTLSPSVNENVTLSPPISLML